MYFDYTATTKLDSEILKLYIDVQEKYYANTTSLHKFGQKCNYYYEKMKAEIEVKKAYLLDLYTVGNKINLWFFAKRKRKSSPIFNCTTT